MNSSEIIFRVNQGRYKDEPSLLKSDLAELHPSPLADYIWSRASLSGEIFTTINLYLELVHVADTAKRDCENGRGG